ncbi:MAG: DUF4287 domain-containing protein [Bacteroidetes bacterium]|nr:DUF4287 domain-containing protein [Bacteroidota bacterium]
MATKKTTARRSRYSVHPGVLMVQKWVATLKEKSGRSLEEWLALVEKEGPADLKERREWLKNTYGLGTNSAWWIADRSAGLSTEDDDPDRYLEAAEGYVEKMFSGPRAGLSPIYERLLDLGLALADDVKACPCQTIVPLYRNHVFAQIKPSTRTRIDLGLALGKYAKKLPDDIIDTGGPAKKDRITHRIAISSVEDINGDVERWLRVAYDLDA